MKVVLVPMYLPERNDREIKEFNAQIENLKILYKDNAVFLPAISTKDVVPPNADAVVFPQLIFSAFREKDALARIDIPIVTLTSEFGTVEMWDWEIISFLREETNLTVFSPYSVSLAKVILNAIACKTMFKNKVRFLMFQDSPGEGMQAGIFKRFYWWEEDCTRQIEASFGIKIIYRSYRELNERAQKIDDADALAICADWNVPMEGVSQSPYIKSVKLYMAIKSVIEEIGGVKGVGANCLNESFHSDTTPCLAWNMLFEKEDILWACEGDTVTLISKFIIYQSLRRPVMMTNIYPFLVGMAALKHEKINEFPDVENPDNHALGVHCGYMGFAPQSFCKNWMLRPKVLEIVNEDALMVDCEFFEGPITLVKIHPNMKKIIIIEAEIKSYEKYPGSDCRNGALIHFVNNNGHQIMQTLCSHHEIIVQGRCTHELIQMSIVFDFVYEIL